MSNILSKIENAISVNSLIYRLSRVPLIEKFVTKDTYSNPKIKAWFSVLTRVGSMIGFLVNNTIYIVFVYIVAGPLQNVIGFNKEDTIMLLWTTLLVLGSVSSRVYEDNPSKWLLINIFRHDSNQTFIMSYKNRLINRIMYSVFIASVLLITKQPYYRVIWVFVLPSVMTVISNKIVYDLTLKNGRLLKSREWLSISITYLMIPLFLYVFHGYYEFLTSILLLLLLGIALPFHQKIMAVDRFDTINVMMKSTMKLSSDIAQSTLELSKSELRIDESFDQKLSEKNLHRFKGYILLNIAFFDRHRRMWLKPLLKSVKLVITSVLVIFVGIIAIKVFDPQSLSAMQKDSLDILIAFQNFLILGLYAINVSRKITKACFLNCDYSLLHYAFYRRKDTVWKQYVVRLVFLIVINTIPVFVFMGMLMLLSLFGLVSFFDMRIIGVFFNLLMFSIFFSTIYVFLYYILQPFDKDMNINAPLYSIVTACVYYLAFYSDHVINLKYSTGIISGIVLTFVIVSTVVVSLIADRTFMLKNE